MKKLHIENGDIVCIVTPNGCYIGKGLVTEINGNNARVLLTKVTDKTTPFTIGLGYLFDINNCYKVADGVTFQGYEVCYEHNEGMDYPYYCPDLDENCYEIEVTKPKIEIVHNFKDCEQGVELQDGRIIVVSFGQASDKPDYFLRFDTPFNLTTKEVCDNNPNKTITLNSLVENGLGNVVFCYRHVDVNRPKHKISKDLTKKEIKEIIDEFNAHGFNVTEEAIMHNFNAWQGDMKSGYRDEKNGYHLFSPCGCNPLSFRVSSLEPRCADWQKTYEC